MASNKEFSLLMRIAGKVDSSYGQAITQAEQKTSMLGKSLKTMALVGATAIAAASAAVVSFGVSAVKAAMDYESSMADVAKVVDGLRDDAGNLTDAYDEMYSGILDLSTTIPLTADEISQIVAAAGQSGIAGDELLSFAEDAAKMATAFDSTAEESGSWMANWRVALGMTQDEVVDLADQINYLSNTTSADSQKLSGIVTELGSLGQIAGLDAANLAALGAATTGVPLDVASTGIKNMIVALTAGNAATAEQANAMKALGFSAKEMATMMQDDAEGAIMGVLSAISGLDADKQASVINQLFGKQSLATVSVLANNVDYLATQFAAVGDATLYAGSMQDEFESRSATTANSMQLFQNKIQALKITAGEALLPIVNDVLDIVSGALTEYGPLLSSIFQQAAPLITSLLPMVEEGLAAILPTLSALATTMISTILPVLGEAAAQVLPLILQLITQLAPYFADFISAILPILVQLLPIIVDVLNKLLPPMLQIVSALLPPLVDLLAAIAPAISWVAGAIADELTAAFAAIMPLIEDFQVMLGGIIEFLTGVFTGDWEKAWGGIKDIFEGIINGIIDTLNLLIGGLNSLQIDMPDWVEEKWGIGSIGFNIPEIPRVEFANGGIVTGATNALLGEAGTEAVIPLDRLGDVVENYNTNAGVSIVFSPVLNVAAGASTAGIASMLEDEEDRLAEMIERIMFNQARKRF